MNDSFAIGIPTINRYDLLEESLQKYLISDFINTKIFIVDNGNQMINIKHPNLTIIRSSKNLGVSGSWNILSTLIFDKYEYCLFLNDDIYFGKKEEEINVFLKNYENEDFHVSFHNWSAFILPKKTYRKVGSFDSNFYPAYFEDNDYFYRMKLQNLSYHQTEKLNCEIFRNSMTIQKDPTINKNFEKNREYYIQKWGGAPTLEKFVTPFNVKQP